MSQPDLLSFQLGPVQPFIAAARTMRDLWTGSYLLSWLTAQTMFQVENEGGTMLFPSGLGSHILAAARKNGGAESGAGALVASFPNRFIAEIPDSNRPAVEWETICRNAVQEEWKRIAEAVHGKLKAVLKGDPKFENWDAGWSDQLRNYWEISVAVLPGNVDAATFGETDRRKLLARLHQAQRMLRPIPPAEPPEETRPKCALLGSYSQMGPRATEAGAQMGLSGEFWKYAANQAEKNQSQLNGTMLLEKDRLCAVSLVKRFAASCYFTERLGVKSKDIRFSDTRTIAGADAQNGDEDGPRYFAILKMDGDSLGERFGGLSDDDRDKLSNSLANFASEARSIVESEFKGELIYAGGDDLLATLPVERALQAAAKLRERFGELTERAGFACTASAGLVVAHYKEDLRSVLTAAQHAVEKAKHSSRKKDRLCLRCVRHNGESADSVIKWDWMVACAEIVSGFKDKESVKWTYRLREAARLMAGAGNEKRMVESELHRILHRSEGVSEELAPKIISLWLQLSQAGNSPNDPMTIENRAILFQSLGFFARPRGAGSEEEK